MPTRCTLRRTIGLVVALVLVASACDLRLQTPPGDGTLRYRDAVFTEVDVTSGVTFGSAKDLTGTTKTLKLDVYQPKGDTATARPAIVWIHGGGFSGGERTSGELVDQANHFAKLGYVNVSIDYRLSAKGCVPFGAECLATIAMAREDAQAAVRFLRRYAATYKVDPTRIAVAGTSAGAITAYNVAYGSEQVGASGNAGYSSKVRAAVSLSGAAIATDPAPGDPPTLDFHGTEDGLVPYAWVQTTITEAKKEGLIAELTVWEGDGHVPYGAHRAEILEQTRNFLFHTLDLGPLAIAG
jgi:acetyl esterase/lipase